MKWPKALRVDLAAAHAEGHAVASTPDAHQLFTRLAAVAVPVGSKAYLVKHAILDFLISQGLQHDGGMQYKQRAVNMASLGICIASAARGSRAVHASYAECGSKLITVLLELEAGGWVSLHPVGQYGKVAMLNVPRLLELVPHLPPSPQALPQAAAATPSSSSSGSISAATTATLAPSRPAAGAASASSAVHIITTETEAAAAVAALLEAEAVAMDCKGDLRRGGCLSLVQLTAAQGPCYLLDLHAMAAPVRQAALGHLGRLLEAERPLKVMHDCRADAEALFYLHGLRCRGLWDTQVALGLLQFLHSVGAGANDDNEAPSASKLPERGPAGLNAMLEHCGLPVNSLNKAMHSRMDRDPELFQRRPLPSDVIQYAVADVTQLLPARTVLEGRLGPTAAARVLRLIAAYSEWDFDPTDRTCRAAAGKGAGKGGSYAAALQLPLGQDLALSIGPPDYRPRFSPILPVPIPAGASRQGAGGTSSGSSGQAGAAEEGASEPGGLQPETDDVSSPVDAETELVLQLFPQRVRDAVVRLLHDLQRGRQAGKGQGEKQAEGLTDDSTKGQAASQGEGHGENLAEDQAEEQAAGQAEGQAEGQAADQAENLAEGRLLSTLRNWLTRPKHAEGQAGDQWGGASDAGCPGSQGLDAGAATGTDANGGATISRSSSAGNADSAASDADAPASGPQRPARVVEIIVDVGRPVRVRLSDRSQHWLEEQLPVEEALALLAAAKGRLHLESDDSGDLFYSDNRAGIPGTLHRVSAMRDRSGRVVGLTYRVGRHVPGSGTILLDVLRSLARGHSPGLDQGAGSPAAYEAPLPSLLLLGRPGVGKTTLLRDVAALLSDTFRKSVIIVDTSNEIAGDGTEPHPCIADARRMQVPHRDRQHDTLLEAVQNHAPEVVVVDEITNTKEVAAARTIAQRGVVLVGTAHGSSLRELMLNPELNSLVGGLASVTQGDEAAKMSADRRKTVSERRGAPAFSTVAEVLGCGRLRLHLNSARSVDDLLANRQPVTQLRWFAPDGSLRVRLEGPKPEDANSRERGGGMRAAVRQAAAAAAAACGGGGAEVAQDAHWFQQLLELAALY